MSTELLETPLEQETDIGEGRTHIVNIPLNGHLWMPGMTPQDVVNAARVRGAVVFVLCGKNFVPKKDPELFPLCEDCGDIANKWIGEDEG